MISTSKVTSRPASGWLKLITTSLSSNDLTTPGISFLRASWKITSMPSSSSISTNSLRGMLWILASLPRPKPRSGGIITVRLSPALKPNNACSKPGSRLPSPTVKVAASRSKVLSTTSPLSSFRAKCRVTVLFSSMRCSVIFYLLFFAKNHVYNQNAGANGYGAIGNVEGRKIPTVLPVHQNKIHHMTQYDTVIQIAQRPGQHQRQPARQQPLALAQACQPDHHYDTGQHCYQGKEPALPTAL